MHEQELAPDVETRVRVDAAIGHRPAVAHVHHRPRAGDRAGERSQREALAESEPSAADLDVRRAGVDPRLVHVVVLPERAVVAERLHAGALEPPDDVVGGEVEARRRRVASGELVGGEVGQVLLELRGGDAIGRGPHGLGQQGLLRAGRGGGHRGQNQQDEDGAVSSRGWHGV